MPSPTSAGKLYKLLAADDTESWRSLWLLNVYRLFLTFGLFAVHYLGSNPSLLGRRDPELFGLTLLAYLITALVFTSLVSLHRPRFDTQLYLQVYLDIIAIVVMMHASGGIESGLGMLLVVVIAGTGLIRADRFALLFAALGSLAVLGEQLYTQFSFGYGETAYVQAGLLGATLFATAVLALGLAHRGRRIEAIAEQRAVDLANLATLNERVIQQMDSGLLFVDHDSQVHLANDSARELLGIGADQPLETLEKLCLPLASALARWRTQQGQPAKPISDPQLRVELQVSFTPLGTQGTLVHIEDHSFIKQQLQQLKLASIGRLTASIAHEIRNPLGAISHAAQLLDESPDLNFADKRLTQIVIANCRRMNAIVEDVLQLSRREKVERSEIPLREWLDQFVRDFCASERASPLQFEVRAHPTARCLMDPNHLHQVLWNLCSNALRHGGKPSIRILLRVEQLPRSRQTALDVLDNGKGITPEQAEEIFEPFVTSSHEGTGLGLYIARELCEFNGATLRLMPGAGGTHFRLIFSPPMDLDN